MPTKLNTYSISAITKVVQQMSTEQKNLSNSLHFSDHEMFPKYVKPI